MKYDLIVQEVFTGKDAAEFLGVHEQTTKAWKKSGKLVPQIKRGRFAFYTREYLETIKAQMSAKENK